MQSAYVRPPAYRPRPPRSDRGHGRSRLPVFCGVLDRIVARAEARTNYFMEPIDPTAVSSDGQDTMTFILTVEDEEPLRAYLGEILEDAGYSVIAAASADEAIACIGTARNRC